MHGDSDARSSRLGSQGRSGGFPPPISSLDDSADEHRQSGPSPGGPPPAYGGSLDRNEGFRSSTSSLPLPTRSRTGFGLAGQKPAPRATPSGRIGVPTLEHSHPSDSLGGPCASGETVRGSGHCSSSRRTRLRAPRSRTTRCVDDRWRYLASSRCWTTGADQVRWRGDRAFRRF